MTYLNLSYNMFTSLEKFPSIMPVDHSYTLDLSSNILEGNIPIVPTVKERNELMGPEGSTTLDYSNNSFTSVSPNFGKYLRETIFLDLSKNKLNGDIPPSSCSARRLEILDLSYNNFGGMIPSCLIQDNLRILKLRGNRIHGILSDSIGEACVLQTLDLSTNYIAGKLPRSLSNCRDLELLDISNNQITGSFPSWLGVLPKLKVLVLRSNQFFGMITDLQENGQIINNFSSLHILDLASNSIIGHLPQGWLIELKSMMANNNDDGQIVGHQTNMSQGFYRDTVTITFKGFDIIFTKILTTFKVIDLSNNSFDGLIPESVGRLSSLHGLNMSHNNFTEQIPSQLGNLTQLESLDLSWNHLSGINLSSLTWLNLSYNNLTGRIPKGNQFLSFPNNSFEGNPDLCGSQVPKQCDNPGSTTTPRASDHPESNSLWQDRTEAILLFTFVGLGFGVGFALAIMFLHFCRIDGWSRKCFCIHM
uniref:Leucine-rich repeat-containing N-terminal plant-type domain-containing protein n=1 Tax=Setaria viridis TaxID=4556 RepID=A0A4U6UG01_SETVI|nr:hypothetical protein SEVIR_5G110800v2 [Setaria viridis]